MVKKELWLQIHNLVDQKDLQLKDFWFQHLKLCLKLVFIINIHQNIHELFSLEFLHASAFPQRVGPLVF